MSTGISIHIGLNKIDVKHYGTSGTLPFCVNDAKAMSVLAAEAGYFVQDIFLDEEAIAVDILSSVNKAADLLEANDILLLTYSGHGSFFPDLNGDERDGYDESWVLYDRMLLDDELYYSWSKFRSGVRILLISDSCHSGTSAKPLSLGYSDRKLDLPDSGSLENMLKAEAALLYKKHKDKYDAQIKFLPSPNQIDIKASVILLASCSDKQYSIGIARGGSNLSLFTDELLTVYTERKSNYNYPSFIKAIKSRIPDHLRQTPNYYTAGCTTKKFSRQFPFTI